MSKWSTTFHENGNLWVRCDGELASVLHRDALPAVRAALRSDSPVSEDSRREAFLAGQRFASAAPRPHCDRPASTGGERDEHADDGDLYYAGRARGYAKAVQDLMVVGEVEDAVPVEVSARWYRSDDDAPFLVVKADRMIDFKRGFILERKES